MDKCRRGGRRCFAVGRTIVSRRTLGGIGGLLGVHDPPYNFRDNRRLTGMFDCLHVRKYLSRQGLQRRNPLIASRKPPSFFRRIRTIPSLQSITARDFAQIQKRISLSHYFFNSRRAVPVRRAPLPARARNPAKPFRTARPAFRFRCRGGHCVTHSANSKKTGLKKINLRFLRFKRGCYSHTPTADRIYGHPGTPPLPHLATFTRRCLSPARLPKRPAAERGHQQAAQGLGMRAPCFKPEGHAP